MVDTLGAADIDLLDRRRHRMGLSDPGAGRAGHRVRPRRLGARTGVRSIMFGDTTGMADPRGVTQLFTAAVAQWPDVDFIAHFHDNRGVGS